MEFLKNNDIDSKSENQKIKNDSVDLSNSLTQSTNDSINTSYTSSDSFNISNNSDPKVKVKDLNLLSKKNIDEAKEKQLKQIFESLDPNRLGASKLFNENIMEEYKITKYEDLFLLFLPTYSMCTTFQYLLTGEKFETFNKIVPQIETYFEQFILDERLLDKIMQMFIFTFDFIWQNPDKIINKYCKLMYEPSPFDYLEDDESDERLKELHINSVKAQDYLLKIAQWIQKQDKFSSHIRSER